MIRARIDLPEPFLRRSEIQSGRLFTTSDYEDWGNILLEEVQQSARGLRYSEGKWERPRRFRLALAETFRLTGKSRNRIEVSSDRVYAGIHETGAHLTSSGKWMTVPFPGTRYPRAETILRNRKGFIRNGIIFVREGRTLKGAYILKRTVEIPRQLYITVAKTRAEMRIIENIMAELRKRYG